MLPPRNSPRALRIHLRAHPLLQLLPDVRPHRLGRVRDGGHRPSVLRLRDERALARVPRIEEGLGGRGADQAWVRDACEAHAGDVSRGGGDAVEVPDRFGGARLELLRCGEGSVGDIARKGTREGRRKEGGKRRGKNRGTYRTGRRRSRARRCRCTPRASFRTVGLEIIGEDVMRAPAEPQGKSSRWHDGKYLPSRMSTTRQSPGSAPSTATGPERLWIFVRSTFMMSSLQSLLPIWAPVQSVRGDNINTSFHHQAYLVRRRGRTNALNFEDISGLDGSHGRDVRTSVGERLSNCLLETGYK